MTKKNKIIILIIVFLGLCVFAHITQLRRGFPWLFAFSITSFYLFADWFLEKNENNKNQVQSIEDLTQNEEKLKNALDSGLISQKEYDEKLEVLNKEIEVAKENTAKQKEKEEKIKSISEKREKLAELYRSGILTYEEYKNKCYQLDIEFRIITSENEKELLSKIREQEKKSKGRF